MFICLCVVYSCFLAVKAGLSGFNRDRWFAEPKIFTDPS